MNPGQASTAREASRTKDTKNVKGQLGPDRGGACGDALPSPSQVILVSAFSEERASREVFLELRVGGALVLCDCVSRPVSAARESKAPCGSCLQPAALDVPGTEQGTEKVWGKNETPRGTCGAHMALKGPIKKRTYTKVTRGLYSRHETSAAGFNELPSTAALSSDLTPHTLEWAEEPGSRVGVREAGISAVPTLVL